jgi:hypothetical protein
MSQRERHADKGTALAPRPVAADPAANGARASWGSTAPVASDEQPADRKRLFAMARQLGFLPPEPPALPDVFPPQDFRSLLDRILGAKGPAALTALPFAAPVESAGPELGPEQLDVVARALQTPDLLLVQGLPGAGKSRVAAEIVRQTIQRGGRVLLTAAAGPAVDAALAGLTGAAGVSAVRLLARDERAEELPAALLDLSATAQESARRASGLRQAVNAECEAEARLKQVREMTPAWEGLQELAERGEHIAAQLHALCQQRESVPTEVTRIAATDGGVGPLCERLRRIAAAKSEQLARLDAEWTDHQKDCERLQADLQGACRERDALAPLQDAGHSGRFWSLQYWKAKLTPSLAEALSATVERIELIARALKELSERKEALSRTKCEVETAGETERLRAIEAEIVRRQRALDDDEAELKRLDGEDDRQFQDLCRALPAAPATRAPETIRAARTAWLERLHEAEQHWEFAGRWRGLIERESDAVAAAWRDTVNLVAGPLAALSANAAFLARPFDLLIVDESHLLNESDLLPAAQKARRWVLLGEPSSIAVAPRPTRGQSRRSRPKPDFFAKLWELLHWEAWSRENERLVYRLHPVPADARRALEVEPVADRPEIELRILPSAGEPILAEVAFPARMSMADATAYLFHELGEAPCQARVRTAWWTEDESGLVFRLTPSHGAGAAPPALELGAGITLRMSAPVNGCCPNDFAVGFNKGAGWDLAAAKTWVGEHLIKRDLGRTCRLEKSYRHAPALAAWLNEAAASGARYCCEQRPDGAIQFEPVPRRAPSGPRRGGAGYEIDLAEPRQRELLPDDLAAILPARGYVNLPEAQAIADLVGRLPRDRTVAITAPYPAQALVLQHYLPNDGRIVFTTELSQRECDVLVISLTRSHTSRAVTYGDDPTIVIGLLSRPRRRLVFVGDPGTLARRGQWEGAIDHLDEVAGESERRWVNAVLNWAPCRNSQPSRAESVKS